MPRGKTAPARKPPGRAIWKGLLSFGLVNIPVGVHLAVRDHRPRFRLLHAADKAPVKFTRVCEREGKPVAWEDLVKGYEYSRGRYVVLTKADFAAAAVEKNRRVEITDFVRRDDIDDRFFETPYYLVPGKDGDAAYALLREALRATGRIGIAQFMLRERTHLCAVEVIGEAIVLTLMRFADELMDIEALALPPVKQVRKQELDMASALVESLAADWAPEKYADEYRDNLMRIIQAKTKGKSIEMPAPGERPKADVTNLMDRLRQSLDAARAKGGSPSKGAKRAGASRAKRPSKKRSRHAA